MNSCPKDSTSDFCPNSEDADSDVMEDDGQVCSSEEEDHSDSCGDPKCVCKFNYKRHRHSGKCIPTKECRKCFFSKVNYL